jgi:hypothetical protein
MYPLVEFPELVKHYAHFFEEVFSAEALIEFERYISGLIVSENKTVEGINRLFVNESRNQSSLNRLLTESPFSLEELNEARLRMLASLAGTALKPKGVLGVDDTLLIHYGQEFEKIAQLFDHVSQSYVWAHDLVTIHYSDDETDYPAEFQLWEPVELEKVEAGLRAAGIALKASKEPWKEADPKKWRGYVLGVWRRQQKKHEELRSLYDTKLILVEKMLSHWVAEHPDAHLPVTFDNWFTQPEFCRFLDEDLQLAYVGTLASTDKVNLKTGQLSVGDFAERLKQEHLAAVSHDHPPVFQRIRIPFKGEHEIYYSYCNTHRLHNFGQQRLVVNYRQADLSDNPTFYLSNRLIWQAAGITRIRRHRWPIEVYHEEGKAEGLDQYQLRDFSAIQRHVALVTVVYSLLRAAQHDPALHKKLHRILHLDLEDSPASGRRAAQAQSLWCLGLLISAGLTQGQSLRQIMEPLLRIMCRA